MNSTAVVLMIITVLTYGIVCIGKRMELMDAVTVSFAVLLAGFGMSGGILALFGGFSLNKTLAVLTYQNEDIRYNVINVPYHSEYPLPDTLHTEAGIYCHLHP